MNSIPVPFKIVAALLLGGILVLVGILNFRDRQAWTVPADGVEWRTDGGILAARAVGPGSPAEAAGIRPGDRLRSIDGREIGDIGAYSDTVYRLGSGATATYRIEGVGGPRDVAVRLVAERVFSPRDGLRAVLAFLHLGIGLFVLFRGYRLPRACHFYGICLAAFVVYLYSWTSRLGPLDWWVYCLSVLAFLLLPALFVHFCLRFPVRAPRDIHPLWAYAPAAGLLVMHGLWITGRLAGLGLPRTAVASGLIDGLQLGYFVAAFAAGGCLLLGNRRRVLDLVARQQMKWMGYGTLAGILPFGLVYALPALSGVKTHFAMEASMLSLALIPLSVGYAVIRFRLMDVETIARQSAAYVIASSLLLALYLLFALVLGHAAQRVAPDADFLVVCLAVLAVALMFAPLRNAVQNRLDRRFYRDSFEARTGLGDFARKLSSEINLDVLLQAVADRISRTFRIERVAIFLADPVLRGFFRLSATGDPGLGASGGSFRGEDLFSAEDGPRGAPGGAGCLQSAGPLLAERGFSHVLDLRLHGRRTGAIALGRTGRGHFSTEDLELLETLAGYAAMALENANLYRSVQNKAFELEKLRAYTENIIESINVAVLALAPSGRITACNRAFERLYATARADVVGSRVEDLFPADILASIHTVTGTEGWGLSSPANMAKLYLENRAGNPRFVNLSLIPLSGDAARGSAGSLIVLDDITEKLELEKQLLQSEKLSSIGLLAAGIAHEINTPIAGISSYTQMLLKGLPRSDKRKPILEKIETQTFRAAEIVNGLLNFSRMSGSEFSPLDVNRLLGDSLALLDHQLQGSGIRVESNLDPSLPAIYGNSGKLQQVFVNLFLNARDAMPSGGDLTIETALNDSMVVIDIADTGAGISEENKKKIYDPFFTTKTTGKGTGLGLSVSYGIIQEHGGRILVDSAAGLGTRFTLKLPIRLQ